MYHLNYWISIPEGFIVAPEQNEPIIENGVSIHVVKVVSSLDSPAEIEKASHVAIIPGSSFTKVQVQCEFPGDGDEILTKSTTILLAKVDETAQDSQFADGILSLSPYGYLAKDPEEEGKFLFYYLFFCEQKRSLMNNSPRYSSGDTLYLPFSLDVVESNEPTFYIGVEKRIPGLNTEQKPYLFFDAYIEVFNNATFRPMQPQTRNAIILDYLEAD